MATKITTGKLLICLLQILNSYIVVLKLSYLASFVAAFFGSPLWHLNGAAEHSLCIDWRKSLRSLWGGVFTQQHIVM